MTKRPIHYTANPLGRPAGLRLGDPSDPSYASDYGYDPLGRFASVSSLVFSAFSAVNYSYLPGSHLIAGWSNDVLSVSRTFEPHRDLLTQVRNVAGGVTVSPYDYEHDPLGRRTAREDSGSAFGGAVTNAFDYNARSEVASAGGLSHLR